MLLVLQDPIFCIMKYFWHTWISRYILCNIKIKIKYIFCLFLGIFYFFKKFHMNHSTEFEDQIYSNWPVAAVFWWSLWDEGKWKATWIFKNVDYVAVATWWWNAGHTVYFKWKKIVLHELPWAAIIEGAKIYIWQWRVMNISWLMKEIQELEAIWCNMKWRVIIAWNTQIIFKSLQQKMNLTCICP